MLRIAVLVLLIGGCATHKGVPRTPPPAEVETAYAVRDDISFTPDHWSHELKADVYQPEGAGPFPAVVLVHGGGWVIGVREEMLLIAQALAKRGYVVINISYRLAPDSIFPAHLRDLQPDLLRAGLGHPRHRSQFRDLLLPHMQVRSGARSPCRRLRRYARPARWLHLRPRRRSQVRAGAPACHGTGAQS